MLHRILRPHASHVQPSVFISILLFALFLGGTANGAEEKAIAFDLPAQPMSASLDRIAESSRTKLIYADASVQGLKAPPLKGRYNVHQALDKVLNNQGLRYEVVDNTLIAVKPEESSKSTSLPKVTVSDTATYASTDPYNPDYTRSNATTATKTDTPIMETPFSIKTVPQQVLRDQQVVNIRDALRNVAGVVAWGASQNVADTFISRGFTNHRGIYRDGYMFFDIVGCCPTGLRETANVERIEFLKGPASILFGRAEPGGIVNLVTKQPLATPYYSLQQQFGSYDFYRTTVDATGPLTKDDTLLYRFNAAYQDSGSFREFVKSDRVFLAPKLRWNIGPRTQVTLELEYMHNEDTPDLGNVPLMLNPTGNKPSPLPRERNIGEEWSTLTGDRLLVGLDWSHQFNDDWMLHHRFNTEQFDNIFIGVFSPSAAPDGTVQRGFFTVDPSKSRRYFTVLDLTGKFESWGIQHTLLIGGDYFRNDERFFEIFSDVGGQLGASNIFSPIHQSQPLTGEEIDQADTTTQWYGLYLQDQIELPYNIHVLAGFRYDNAEIRNNLLGGIVASKDDRVSPRGGLVWRPVPWLSLYGSYTENFGASNGQLSSDGSFLPSQTAQQWEAGLKTEFWDGRLTGTFA